MVESGRPDCEHCEAFVPRDDHWHIRKDVPVALMSAVIALGASIGGAVWWFSGEASAVTETSRRVAVLEQRRDATDQALTAMLRELAAVGAKVDILLGRKP